MWTHQEYIDFFKEVARTNKNILHTETQSHFVRIIPVDDPFKSLNVEQYVNDKRSKLNLPGLMLQTPQTTLRDPGDSLTALDDIAFFIMDKPAEKSYAAEDACYTKTETIARGIVGYLKKYFRELQPCPNKITMKTDGLLIDKIEEGGYCGTKVSFRLTAGANAEFAYNEDDWIVED
jgi:hypothetical protein